MFKELNISFEVIKTVIEGSKIIKVEEKQVIKTVVDAFKIIVKEVSIAIVILFNMVIDVGIIKEVYTTSQEAIKTIFIEDQILTAFAADYNFNFIIKITIEEVSLKKATKTITNLADVATDFIAFVKGKEFKEKQSLYMGIFTIKVEVVITQTYSLEEIYLICLLTVILRQEKSLNLHVSSLNY